MNYPGSKNNCYQQIINLIPPHRTYIETHAGSAAIYRHKRPAQQSILIDIDPAAPVHGLPATSGVARCPSNVAMSAPHVENGDTAVTNILCTDAIRFLSWHKPKHTTFIYCDPPYLMSTRRSQRALYNYEYTHADHIKLLETIINFVQQHPHTKVMISGYRSQLYDEFLPHWHTHTFTTTTHGGPATEWLWMNYEPPTVLHDYSYLGDDYRERERIKRKIERWLNGLNRMDERERNAILSAIEQRYL